MSNVLSGHTTISGKPYGRHQNHEYAYVLLKIISIYCLTLYKWRPSWILPRMQCPKILFDQSLYVRHPRKPFGRHPNQESFYSVQIISIHCLTLQKWRPFHFSLFTGLGHNFNAFPASLRSAATLKNSNYAKTSMENKYIFPNLRSASYYLQFESICRSLSRFWIFYCFHLVIGGHFENMQIRLRKWCITITIPLPHIRIRKRYIRGHLCQISWFLHKVHTTLTYSIDYNTGLIDLHALWPIRLGLPAFFNWTFLYIPVFFLNHHGILYQYKK